VCLVGSCRVPTQIGKPPQASVSAALPAACWASSAAAAQGSKPFPQQPRDEPPPPQHPVRLFIPTHVYAAFSSSTGKHSSLCVYLCYASVALSGWQLSSQEADTLTLAADARLKQAWAKQMQITSCYETLGACKLLTGSETWCISQPVPSITVLLACTTECSDGCTGSLQDAMQPRVQLL
jgi:hypothetical protein